jgi:uncharacterized protein YndB with AHSA1/START domain
MTERAIMTRAITKSVAIDRAPEAVFAYIADAANWPRWAVVNVLKVAPSGAPGWWQMETPRGPGKLRIAAEPDHLLLDHEFVSDEAHWTVPARVVRDGAGALFMMTFFQPPGFADDFFDAQIGLVDRELATLKEILEGRPS